MQKAARARSEGLWAHRKAAGAGGHNARTAGETLLGSRSLPGTQPRLSWHRESFLLASRGLRCSDGILSDGSTASQELRHAARLPSDTSTSSQHSPRPNSGSPSCPLTQDPLAGAAMEALSGWSLSLEQRASLPGNTSLSSQPSIQLPKSPLLPSIFIAQWLVEQLPCKRSWVRARSP